MYRFRFLTIMMAFAVLVAACGSSSDQAVTPATPTSETPTSEPAATEPEVAAFPVTVEADNDSVTIEVEPVAIVSLSPSLTEMAYAVGAGDQVIAVDGSSNYPEGTPMTDLSGFRPNVEAIGELQPDLVLHARDRDDIVATLEDVGITVLLLESPSGLDGIARQIEVIGAATGHADAGIELAATISMQINDLVASLPDRDAPLSYFYELSGDYHSLTSDSFIGSIMSAAGLVNIADDVDPAAGSYPQLTAEYVLAENPDLIFMAHTDGVVPSMEELTARAGWPELTAMSDSGVVFLDPDTASRWGPRTVEVVAQVVAAAQDR